MSECIYVSVYKYIYIYTLTYILLVVFLLGCLSYAETGPSARSYKDSGLGPTLQPIAKKKLSPKAQKVPTHTFYFLACL